MTWDELKEKAKEIGYKEQAFLGEALTKDSAYHEITFYKNGNIEYNDDYVIAFDRTPEQMLMIMRGLE